MPDRPLIQSDLDEQASAGSHCPRCAQFHVNELHPTTPCHPKMNLAVASYRKDSGVLRLVCFICGQPVLEVKVAKS